MTNIKHIISGFRVIAVVFSTVLLQAWSLPRVKFFDEASSLNEVGPDEVIIVGTIEMAPLLKSDEQSLTSKNVIYLTDYRERNKNSAMIQLNTQPEFDSAKTAITPKLGSRFFIKIPKDHQYMVDGKILLKLTQSYQSISEIQLPAWFKMDIRPGDKAVYIGRIKYTRDEFNSITSVELIDDFKSASREFSSRFGKQYTLRKSRLKKIQ